MSIEYEWCKPYTVPSKNEISISTSIGNLVLCKVETVQSKGESIIVRTLVEPDGLNFVGIDHRND